MFCILDKILADNTLSLFYFSLPEHKVLKVSYCDRPQAVIHHPLFVRLSSAFALNNFFSKTAAQIFE